MTTCCASLVPNPQTEANRGRYRLNRSLLHCGWNCWKTCLLCAHLAHKENNTGRRLLSSYQAINEAIEPSRGNKCKARTHAGRQADPSPRARRVYHPIIIVMDGPAQVDRLEPGYAATRPLEAAPVSSPHPQSSERPPICRHYGDVPARIAQSEEKGMNPRKP